MWFYLLDCSAFRDGKESSWSFPFSFSRLLFAAGLTLAPPPGVTAIHRLSLCSDRRGRERERVRQREKESQRAAGGWGTEGGGALARGSLVEGGCHCTGERGGRCGERGTQRASQRQEVEDPEACASRRRRAQLALRLGSGRTAVRWGNSPTSTRLLHQPELVQKFPASGCIFPARPPLRSPPPPLEDITFIFQYVVNDTPGHSSKSWVNTEEMFLGVRKGGVGCVRIGGNGGVGEEKKLHH